MAQLPFSIDTLSPWGTETLSHWPVEVCCSPYWSTFMGKWFCSLSLLLLASGYGLSVQTPYQVVCFMKVAIGLSRKIKGPRAGSRWGQLIPGKGDQIVFYFTDFLRSRIFLLGRAVRSFSICAGVCLQNLQRRDLLRIKKKCLPSTEQRRGLAIKPLTTQGLEYPTEIRVACVFYYARPLLSPQGSLGGCRS